MGSVLKKRGLSLIWAFLAPPPSVGLDLSHMGLGCTHPITMQTPEGQLLKDRPTRGRAQVVTLWLGMTLHPLKVGRQFGAHHQDSALGLQRASHIFSLSVHPGYSSLFGHSSMLSHTPHSE